jgi:hypothetical protein
VHLRELRSVLDAATRNACCPILHERPQRGTTNGHEKDRRTADARRFTRIGIRGVGEPVIAAKERRERKKGPSEPCQNLRNFTARPSGRDRTTKTNFLLSRFYFVFFVIFCGIAFYFFAFFAPSRGYSWFPDRSASQARQRSTVPTPIRVNQQRLDWARRSLARHSPAAGVRFYSRPFVSIRGPSLCPLADVAKGGDGAKSACDLSVL